MPRLAVAGVECFRYHSPLSSAHTQHNCGFSYFSDGHLCLLFTWALGQEALIASICPQSREPACGLLWARLPVIGPQGSELSASLGPLLPGCLVCSLASSLQESSVNSQSELTHSAPPPSLYQESVSSLGFLLMFAVSHQDSLMLWWGHFKSLRGMKNGASPKGSALPCSLTAALLEQVLLSRWEETVTTF